MYLGRFEAKEQEMAINRCINRMEGYLEEARRESKVSGKLYTGLGLASGLMLTIILI
jgi:stage III sporulation protein AB